MAYPKCSAAAAGRFETQGFVVVEGAATVADIGTLRQHCDVIVDKRDKLAYDWAWEKGTPREARRFRIVQGSPSHVWPGIGHMRLRVWMLEYASMLMGAEVEFWYDQYLAKPPRDGAETYWHQDEGYWGRNLDDRGITCWLPLVDVNVDNGCMHFVAGGHLGGVLEHWQPPHIQSDLLMCAPDVGGAVACPLVAGGVTFHHSKTPHMTTSNHSAEWRRAITTHMRVAGSGGEGDHYPWKVYVNQFTGERTTPERR